MSKIFLTKKLLYNLRIKHGVPIHEHWKMYSSPVAELIETSEQIDLDEQTT